MWSEFCDECIFRLESDEIVGKIVTVSSVVKDNPSILKQLITLLKDKGFIGSKSISESDYIITLDEEDKERLKNILKHPYNGTILCIHEFQNLEITI